MEQQESYFKNKEKIHDPNKRKMELPIVTRVSF